MTLLLYASVCVCVCGCAHMCMCKEGVGHATFGAVAVAIHHTQSEIN